ncbi:hypothetical protein BVC80_1787g33 [Macleaya cordata]|uniref:Uncharacterized protein n=1 Tax=Macleaya cordata TaxID=56857 RepID=A0A200QU49_MACCD|nr:hypothetical protein BVC80_1787g33 [Macleaya cordata]
MSNKVRAVPSAGFGGNFRGRRPMPKRGQIKSKIAARAFHSIVSALCKATSERSNSNRGSYLRETRNIRRR